MPFIRQHVAKSKFSPDPLFGKQKSGCAFKGPIALGIIYVCTGLKIIQQLTLGFPRHPLHLISNLEPQDTTCSLGSKQEEDPSQTLSSLSMLARHSGFGAASTKSRGLRMSSRFVVVTWALRTEGQKRQHRGNCRHLEHGRPLSQTSDHSTPVLSFATKQ